jgi:hypothetical protein
MAMLELMKSKNVRPMSKSKFQFTLIESEMQIKLISNIALFRMVRQIDFESSFAK